MVFYYLFRENNEIKLSKFFFKRSSLLRDISIKQRIPIPIPFNNDRPFLNDKAQLLAFKEGLERQIAEVTTIQLEVPEEPPKIERPEPPKDNFFLHIRKGSYKKIQSMDMYIPLDSEDVTQELKDMQENQLFEYFEDNFQTQANLWEFHGSNNPEESIIELKTGFSPDNEFVFIWETNTGVVKKWTSENRSL